ncbi:dihydrofolate reductase family protein [Stenotrophomonas lacuserhaii]|uniref:RibD family protein n=1 Tax=Stenotrophomonas lacuserhaii TaxID=2760084 RepID=UPI0032EAC847
MRPQIICHMMTTLDGRIDGDRWNLPHSGRSVDEATVGYYDISDRLDAQAWMLGRNTVQIHHAPHSFDHDGLPLATQYEPFLSQRTTRRSLVVLDPKGRIRYEHGRIEGDDVIAVLSEQVSDAYLAHLRELDISYLFAGQDGHDLALAMQTLADLFGMRRVLLEGGGEVNGAFLKAGLIDEVSLMLYPGIDGLSGIHTLFECHGPAGLLPSAGATLELTHLERLQDDIVWLRYLIHRSALSSSAQP